MNTIERLVVTVLIAIMLAGVAGVLLYATFGHFLTMFFGAMAVFAVVFILLASPETPAPE